MRNIILSALICCFAGIASAETTYECKIDKVGRFGWVGSLMFFIIDEEAQQAWVFDRLVKHVQEDPLKISIESETDTAIRFRWKLRGLTTSTHNQSVGTVQYRAMLNKKTNNVYIKTYFGETRSWGEGKCKKI